MYASRKSLLIKCVLATIFIYLCVYVVYDSNNAVAFIREFHGPGQSPHPLDDPQLDEEVKDALSAAHQMNESVPPSINGSSPSSYSSSSTTTPVDVEEPDYLEKVKEILNCVDKPMEAKVQQRGDYWVLYNYVQAEKTFKCHETITYTTHADYSFLDNLVPLLKRWQGPISLALHTPGTDLKQTLDSIAYLRECSEGSDLVRKLVTFHIYFGTKHCPKQVPTRTKLFTKPYNCDLPAPYLNVSTKSMYKAQSKLLYPVNVGRNVARESAQTHFIMASDIELYPSRNLIPQFLSMIAENDTILHQNSNPKVFPLNLFEVNDRCLVPDNKTVLLSMLANKTAVTFHKHLCPMCHNVPQADKWRNTNETDKLQVFHVSKRNGKFSHWEPIFIGTNAEPLYDERLSWEGRSDKMPQGYTLCVLDYDFMILNNAFLVHKPGIKRYVRDKKRDVLTSKTNQLIKNTILPELHYIYGLKKGCNI